MNIVANATFWRGKPAHCLEAWTLGKHGIAVSHPVLSEYEEVGARLAARRIPPKNFAFLRASKRSNRFQSG